MSEKKFIIPDALKERYRAAIMEFLGNHPSALGYTQDDVDEAALQGVIGWLDTILHEANVDFHRAILKREAERYPEESTASPLQRLAFEFGASFARYYIRSLFAPTETTGVDAATGKIIAEARQRAFDEIVACAKDEDIEAGIGVDALRVWALALQEREKRKDDPPKAIRHLICKPDGAWPPSRQLYNACIEDAYEIGKKEDKN